MVFIGKKSYNLEENVRMCFFVYIFVFCVIFNRKFRVYFSFIDIFKIKIFLFNFKEYFKNEFKVFSVLFEINFFFSFFKIFILKFKL